MPSLFLLESCSTTRTLSEGQTRLKSNVVTVVNRKEHPDFQDPTLDNYIRQKPNTYFIKTRRGGWNPFLYISNWTNGKGGGWDRFVTKLGQAPVVFDPALMEDSRDNISTHLKYTGYYGSHVQAIASVLNRQTVVDYLVTLGKQYPIKSIYYEVDNPDLAEEIFKDTVNSLIQRGKPLSEDLLDKESERSAAYLRNQGYYEFSKNFYFFAADTVSVQDSALLRISVRNYPRGGSPDEAVRHRRFYFGKVEIYPVSDNIRYRASVASRIPQVLDTVNYGDITILYDKKRRIRPSMLDKMNRIVPGELYNESIVNNTYQRMSNLRIYNSVSVELTKADTNTVDCSIRLIPSKTHGYKVNLEASTNSTGLIGISPSISYYNRNIFKGGEWLSLSVSGNFQFSVRNSTRATEFGANAGLSFPTFVLLPDRMFKNIIPRTDIELSYNFQRRPEYTRNMIGANFGWSWSSQSNKFYFKVVPLQINIVNLPVYSDSFLESLTNPFVREAYKNHFEAGLGFDLQYSSDPSINPANSYFKADFQFDIAGNLISAFNPLMPVDSSGFRTIWNSPYSQFVRGELSLVYTWKFGRDNKQALAVRGLGGIGYAYGNSAKMPFERLFWAGGSNSLRGWTARSVGPGSSRMDRTFSIPNQTGDMRLEANIEYRFPLFSIFRGAVFADWGNVWNLERTGRHESMGGGSGEDHSTEELSYFRWGDVFRTSAFSAGAGLRIDLNFVVVRFDVGIKLYDPATQLWPNIRTWFSRGGYAFQFGIGYPF
ncbi:MAG TPA: BamA/TamA family outer membrane protein [Candidatus Coprenecus merdigallinarum]|nr:BamA/TamA family outer membrane protein [Candidatus Coprenecus merdigallinarum]